jgi:hypothetical protein
MPDGGVGDSLRLLGFAVGYAGGFAPLYVDGRGRPTRWIEHREDLVSSVAWLDEHEHEVALGLPCPATNNGGPITSTILWSWIEGSKQYDYARRFRPIPSIVLKLNGSRRLLLWLLASPVTVGIERANKRISYALRAKQNLSSPDVLRIPLPGTSLRFGRARPVPIEVTRATLDEYEPGTIVGNLREPPPPWRPGG